MRQNDMGQARRLADDAAFVLVALSLGCNRGIDSLTPAAPRLHQFLNGDIVT